MLHFVLVCIQDVITVETIQQLIDQDGVSLCGTFALCIQHIACCCFVSDYVMLIYCIILVGLIINYLVSTCL